VWYSNQQISQVVWRKVLIKRSIKSLSGWNLKRPKMDPRQSYGTGWLMENDRPFTSIPIQVSGDVSVSVL